MSSYDIQVTCIPPAAGRSALTSMAVSLGEENKYEVRSCNPILEKKAGGVKTNKLTTAFLRYFKITNYLIIFVFTGILGPLEMKEISPRAWGWIEGKMGWDMTGFWFSPFGGNGTCRITNTKESFGLPDSRIVLGELTPIDRKPYPHLWVEQRGRIVDDVCPPETPTCNNRRQFAIVNPANLQVEEQTPRYEKDLKHIRWGIEYLKGFKSALGLDRTH